jgi:hypothetical protein
VVSSSALDNGESDLPSSLVIARFNQFSFSGLIDYNILKLKGVIEKIFVLRDRAAAAANGIAVEGAEDGAVGAASYRSTSGGGGQLQVANSVDS